MAHTIEEIAWQWQQWYDEIMPDCSPEDFLTKFYEEAAEFYEEPSLEEAVDVFATMLAWITRSGYTFNTFQAAFAMKLAKNKGRTFVKQPDGTYHHV